MLTNEKAMSTAIAMPTRANGPAAASVRSCPGCAAPWLADSAMMFAPLGCQRSEVESRIVEWHE